MGVNYFKSFEDDKDLALFLVNGGILLDMYGGFILYNNGKLSRLTINYKNNCFDFSTFRLPSLTLYSESGLPKFSAVYAQLDDMLIKEGDYCPLCYRKQNKSHVLSYVLKIDAPYYRPNIIKDGRLLNGNEAGTLRYNMMHNVPLPKCHILDVGLKEKK